MEESLDAHWDHRHNTHILWKTIHGLSNRAPPHTPNTSIPFNNKIATTPTHIANCFTLEEGKFVCSELGKGATSEAGKRLFSADNVWWRCVQYFVIASCGWMPRDNRCMYMAHVCFYVCCSDCVGVCGNACCVVYIVKNNVFSLGVLKYIVCLCSGCDGGYIC